MRPSCPQQRMKRQRHDRDTSLLMTSTGAWEKITIVKVLPYSHRRTKLEQTVAILLSDSRIQGKGISQNITYYSAFLKSRMHCKGYANESKCKCSTD